MSEFYKKEWYDLIKDKNTSIAFIYTQLAIADDILLGINYDLNDIFANHIKYLGEDYVVSLMPRIHEIRKQIKTLRKELKEKTDETN